MKFISQIFKTSKPTPEHRDTSDRMKLCTIALGCLLSSQFFTAFFAAPAKFVCENNFDLDGRFSKADVSGAEDTAFNDSAWRTVDLPHECSLEDQPQITTNGSAAAFTVSKILDESIAKQLV